MRPVDLGLGRGDLCSIGCSVVVLRLGIVQNGGKVRCHIGQKIGIDCRQPVMQIASGIPRPDRTASARQHRSGIKPGFHQHGADSGLGIAGGNRPLDRCGPTPARQQ